MTLEDVFYVSQSIASVAVVGSLIYLGLQVRGADRSQRAIMQQGRADRTSRASLTVASPELARVWQKCLDADPDITREEVTQWLLMCRAAFLSGEDSFLQHKVGALDQAAFDSYCAGVRSYMSHVGFRVAWKLQAGQFGKEFRAFVDAQLAATPIAPGQDWYAEFKRISQAERPGPGR
ncbi:MAG: hypothetical protein WA807_13535 [Steroidobacteraceae bacterium]